MSPPTGVALVIDEDAPEHDRHELAGFAQGLPGERDVPQRFVLACRGQYVGGCHDEEFVEGCIGEQRPLTPLLLYHTPR